jgi:hypothetical protein
VTPQRRTAPAPIGGGPTAPGMMHRARVGIDAIRAAYHAHTGHEHDGHVGHRCRTCARYLTGIARAIEDDTVEHVRRRTAERRAAALTAAERAPHPPTDPTP